VRCQIRLCARGCTSRCRATDASIHFTTAPSGDGQQYTGRTGAPQPPTAAARTSDGKASHAARSLTPARRAVRLRPEECSDRYPRCFFDAHVVPLLEPLALSDTYRHGLRLVCSRGGAARSVGKPWPTSGSTLRPCPTLRAGNGLRPSNPAAASLQMPRRQDCALNPPRLADFGPLRARPGTFPALSWAVRWRLKFLFLTRTAFRRLDATESARI
jgi:hypothetical protein